MGLATTEKVVMASIGNVVVTVTLDDSLRERVIVLLEKCKQDHYSERSGLSSCPGNSYEQVDGKWQNVDRPELCECGASALNSEIDAMIVELKKEPKSNQVEYL